MKIRNGFVSNSSSSSFIVRYNDYILLEEKSPIEDVSDAKVRKLEKYGFKKAKFYTATQITGNPKDKHYKVGKKDKYNYVYDVSCNEDDVVKFLIRNKIPFEGTLQYDFFFVKYDGKDKIIFATNYGIILQGHGNLYDTEVNRCKYGFYDTKPVKQISVEQYKKKGLYY